MAAGVDSSALSAACIRLTGTITITSRELDTFVRDVREARGDVDTISRELHSLKGVLNLLEEDIPSLPQSLADPLPKLLETCSNIVEEIDGLISPPVPMVSENLKFDPKEHWALTGRKEAPRLRAHLEAYKGILGLALDVVGIISSRVNDKTSDDIASTIRRKDLELKRDIARLLEEMSRMQSKIPLDFQKEGTGTVLQRCPMLQSYLDALTTYVVMVNSDAASDRDSDKGSNRGEEADSGVEVNEPIRPLKTQKEKDHVRSPSQDADGNWMVPIFELPRTAPAPVRSPSRSDNYGNPFGLGVVTTITSEAPRPESQNSFRDRIKPRRRFSLKPLPQVPAEDEDDMNSVQASSEGSQKGRQGFGKFFGRARSARDLVNDDAASETPSRPGFHKITRSLSFNKRRYNDPSPFGDISAPTTVFGSPLERSIQLAKAAVRVGHSGDGGKSRRDFPLCVHKCVNYIKEVGVWNPEIFAEHGKAGHVIRLKNAFSSAPTYGEDLDMSPFTVYDAADIIMLYLDQLPEPLIPEHVAKRWVKLAREAGMVSPRSVRLDPCIDFWEEALGKLKGPTKSLFKLLLNLFADIAEAAEHNDMTAERLADVVIKPLMHRPDGPGDTNMVIALAFLIRKRTDYSNELNKDSKAEIRRRSVMNIPAHFT